MKRSKRPARPQSRKKSAPVAAPFMTRRQMLGKAGKTALGDGIGLSPTRTVRAELHEHDLRYAAAGLDMPEGRSLALDNGVGKITLLQFDAKGVRRELLHGVIDGERLERAFRRQSIAPTGRDFGALTSARSRV